MKQKEFCDGDCNKLKRVANALGSRVEGRVTGSRAIGARVDSSGEMRGVRPSDLLRTAILPAKRSIPLEDRIQVFV